MDFYFFSGTGNTLLAARAVTRGLREGGKDVRLRRLEKGFVPFRDGNTALGIAVTVAMFSTYPFAWDFLESLPDGEGRGTFLISTMGGASGGLRPAVKKLLVSKHYTPLGARDFVMPSNYNNITIPLEKNREKTERMEKNAAAFAEAAGETPSGRGNVPLICSTGCPSAMALEAHERKFSLAVDGEKCIKCGKCARLCPRRTSEWRVSEFLDQCASCQRCIAFCPPQPSACRAKTTNSTGRWSTGISFRKISEKEEIP